MSEPSSPQPHAAPSQPAGDPADPSLDAQTAPPGNDRVGHADGERAPLPGEPGFKAPLTKKQVDRASQTIKGMFISVGLTLAVVLPIIFLNPAPSKPSEQDRVDVPAIAAQAKQDMDFDAIAPKLPEGWHANYARWNAGSADGIGFWDLGLVKGSEYFAQVRQARKANDSWITLATDGAVPTGRTVDVDGVKWTERLKRADGKRSRDQITLSTKIGPYTYLVTTDAPGDGGDADISTQAARIVQQAAPGR